MTDVATKYPGSTPLLVIVSGKPGSGKSILARRLADTLWFPLLSNDAIRQGILETRAHAADEAARHVDGVTPVLAFYATIQFLLQAGVSVVAEHSFRHGLSEADLRPLAETARMVNVHCDVPITLAQQRFTERERTERRRFVEDLRRHRPDNAERYGAEHVIAQMESGTFDWSQFDLLDLSVPQLRVDTTQGYAPSVDEIVAFVRNASVRGSLPKGCVGC